MLRMCAKEEAERKMRKVKRAFDKAALWHAGQHRKYPGVEIPYLSHLAGVATILAKHGFDDDVVVAGILHDAIEDTVATAHDIAAEFGDEVAALVTFVTEEKNEPWEVRKSSYREAFVSKPWPVQAIAIADMIDNLVSIAVCASDYGDPWAQFKRGRDQVLAHYDALGAKIRSLREHPLVEEFFDALALAKKAGHSFSR